MKKGDRVRLGGWVTDRDTQAIGILSTKSFDAYGRGYTYIVKTSSAIGWVEVSEGFVLPPTMLVKDNYPRRTRKRAIRKANYRLMGKPSILESGEYLCTSQHSDYGG